VDADRWRELVLQAVHVMCEGPADEDEIVRRLMDAGIERIDAEKALAFVPMAFAHVQLRNEGAELPTTFGVYSELSDPPQFLLAGEPGYVAAVVEARVAFEQGILTRTEYACVADRSAEMNVVRQLLARGGSAGDLRLISPVLGRLPIDAFKPEIVAPHGRRWWQSIIGRRPPLSEVAPVDLAVARDLRPATTENRYLRFDPTMNEFLQSTLTLHGLPCTLEGGWVVAADRRARMNGDFFHEAAREHHCTAQLDVRTALEDEGSAS
jgi:hypothetical protein